MRYVIDRFASGGGLETRARPKAKTAPAVRLDGLDGLRAIAVIAVFLFHADLGWAKGGYLGVDLFFVISGFLITGLLVGESERNGRISLGGFYTRRAKRLLPASWAMTALAILAAGLLAADALPRLRWDALASLFYLTNWEMIFADTSYFEAIGRPPLLQHLWSLAIEEQFYIVWAPAVVIALPWIGRRGLAAVAGLAGAGAALWMALAAAKMGYPDQGDPSRLYFGTDTHGFPLLIGAVLGLVWRPGTQRAAASPAVREGTVLTGLVGLAAMLLLFARMGEDTPWLYPSGFLAAAAASVVLIAAATRKGSPFGKALDWAPLRWVGERSYGIYLWHWPIFMLTRPEIDIRLDDTSVLALRIALTLSISALYYRYLEVPIREGAIERVWKALRHPDLHDWALGRARGAVAGFAVIVAGAVAVLVWAPTRTPDLHDSLGLSAAAAAVKPAVAPPLPVVVAPQAADAVYSGKDLTAVGDSVLLGASDLLKASLPGAHVYATMGWQATDVIAQLKSLVAAHALTPVVLVHVGTNGYIKEAQLRQILTMLAGAKRVILINTHVPRRWMEANNDLIDRVAVDYPNVVVADWRGLSDEQPDFFVGDGVHLTPAGKRVFVSEILRVGHLAAKGAKLPKPYGYAPGDLSKTLVREPQPAAPERFWKKLALCETGGSWNGLGGGLGINAGAWAAWGGTSFADTPGAATPEQQIEVANRIATQGWTRPDGSKQAPAGYTAWHCAATTSGRPRSASPYTFTRESVIAQSFHLGERGEVVRDLELMLRMPRDGVYGKRVRAKHLALLKLKGLPADLAGPEH